MCDSGYDSNIHVVCVHWHSVQFVAIFCSCWCPCVCIVSVELFLRFCVRVGRMEGWLLILLYYVKNTRNILTDGNVEAENRTNPQNVVNTLSSYLALLFIC